MTRLTLRLAVLLALFCSSAPLVLAQVGASEDSPLLIQCDQRSDLFKCSNNPQKTCTVTTVVADCGEGASCRPEVLKNQCTIADFFNQFIVLAQWGMTIMVFLGALMLIYGGVEWITAGGRSSKIDSGKRIIIGTLVGIMISFSAYIIMNLTIGAVTGTSLPAANPFGGPIATVFGNKDEVKPFSGDGTSLDTVNNCHDQWDRCDDLIYCADASDRSGSVQTLQGLLSAKNCGCNKPDGCFGSATAECVRKFQIANNRPPTGEIDTVTRGLLEGAGNNCNDLSTAVNQQLPKASLADAQSGSRSKRGCCIIRTGGTPLYCAEQMTERTCRSLGIQNRFVEGAYCTTSSETKTICGFCHQNNRCFGLAAKAWCDTKVSPKMLFAAQPGLGNPLCESSVGYIESLRTIAP